MQIIKLWHADSCLVAYVLIRTCSGIKRVIHGSVVNPANQL